MTTTRDFLQIGVQVKGGEKYVQPSHYKTPHTFPQTQKENSLPLSQILTKEIHKNYELTLNKHINQQIRMVYHH